MESKSFILRKYEKYYFQSGFKGRSLQSQAVKTHLSGIDAEARKVTCCVNKSLIPLLLLHTCILLACMTINKIQLTFPFHLLLYWLQPREKYCETDQLYSFSNQEQKLLWYLQDLIFVALIQGENLGIFVFSHCHIL